MVVKYPEYTERELNREEIIPENWRLSKLKYLATIYNGNSLNDREKEIYSDVHGIEKSLSYISSKDINVDNNHCDYSSGIKIPFDNACFKIAPANSSLLCIEGGSAGKKVTFLKENVFFVNKLACFVASPRINSKFLFYTLLSVGFKNKFENLMSGLIGGVSLSNLNNIEILVPDEETQQKIVIFLDYKVARIDALIEKKQRLIKLLKTKKDIVINEVVTKGLDKSSPVRKSPIKWLSEIPEHWKVKKLGYLGDCQNGVSKSGDYFGEGYPFVSYGDVYNNITLPQEIKGLANSSERDREFYSVLEGDVFFTRTSETAEEIGLASTCFADIPHAVFSGFLIRFRPVYKNLLTKEYSKFFFRSIFIRIFFIREMNLVTRASLSQTLLKSLPVLLPTIEEQKRIAFYLENILQKMEDLESKLVYQIDKLKMYRQAIISEAVTGKIYLSDRQIDEERVNK